MPADLIIPTRTVSIEDAACVAHKSHRPQPTYYELHHVIPQAWQHFWKPDGATVTNGLFDPRTVALCRTGHGNVHWWLVKFMHAYEGMCYGKDSDDPLLVVTAAVAAVIKERQTNSTIRAVKTEVAVAREGMERWVGAGGSLYGLAAAGQWGEI